VPYLILLLFFINCSSLSGKLIINIILKIIIQTESSLKVIMEVNEIYCIGSNKFGQAGAGKKYHNQTFTSFNKIIFPVFIKQVVCGSHHSGLLTL
jgi:alpha-tubulin suppressor-like RCC1 family protein